MPGRRQASASATVLPWWLPVERQRATPTTALLRRNSGLFRAGFSAPICVGRLDAFGFSQEPEQVPSLRVAGPALEKHVSCFNYADLFRDGYGDKLIERDAISLRQSCCCALY